MFLILLFIISVIVILTFKSYIQFLIDNIDELENFNKEIKELPVPETKPKYVPSRSTLKPKYRKGSLKTVSVEKLVKSTRGRG